jgi:hypothetical protein
MHLFEAGVAVTT